jgi:hypothetical protein
MITPDQTDELTTLARARSGLSPSPADALRVRTSLAAALAAPGNTAPDGAAFGSEQGLGTGRGWSLRVLATSVAAAAMAAGAGGYWMGHRAGSRESRLDPHHPVTNEIVPPPPPDAVVGAGAPSPGSVSPGPVADATSVRGAIKRRPGNTVRTVRPEVVASATESLGQEVRALRAVEYALRDENPRLALAILQQLDRDVPKGTLVEERRATSVIARCSTGDIPFGIDLAEDFASDYPESVYLGRVEQSCARRGRRK